MEWMDEKKGFLEQRKYSVWYYDGYMSLYIVKTYQIYNTKMNPNVSYRPWVIMVSVGSFL
jgi:hypothetical protein